MKNENISLVFFGSGPVAAECLTLLSKNFIIEAVVTKPKPEKHRGDFPTLVTATNLGIPVFTPANKNELTALFTNATFSSIVGVVIDYGIIISQEVIDYFDKGILNSHFSLLPQWRGADPISFAILSGQSTTGVSIMLITAGLDEGPLLAQTEVSIEATDTTESLTEKLIDVSDGVLQIILPDWLNDKITAGDQLEVSILEDNTPTYSRKLTKEDGRIDWKKPAEQIEREIRAFASWPKSYTKLNGLDVVITAAHVAEQQGEAGKIIIQNKELLIYCGHGALVIDKIKPAGKSMMDTKSFLNGYAKLLG